LTFFPREITFGFENERIIEAWIDSVSRFCKKGYIKKNRHILEKSSLVVLEFAGILEANNTGALHHHLEFTWYPSGSTPVLSDRFQQKMCLIERSGIEGWSQFLMHAIFQHLKPHPGLTKNSRIEKIKIFYFRIFSFFSSQKFF